MDSLAPDEDEQIRDSEGLSGTLTPHLMEEGEEGEEEESHQMDTTTSGGEIVDIDVELAAAPLTKKRKMMKRKITPEDLASEKGIRVVFDRFPMLPLSGKRGKEGSDMKLIMEAYEEWAKELFPLFDLDTFMQSVSGMGNSHAVLEAMRGIRYLNDDMEEDANGDGLGDELFGIQHEDGDDIEGDDMEERGIQGWESPRVETRDTAEKIMERELRDRVNEVIDESDKSDKSDELQLSPRDDMKKQKTRRNVLDDDDDDDDELV
jgi:hypothetical protein